MPTAVVCEDDEVLRGVVRQLAEEQGLQVVAETDHGVDVVELVRRFDIDVVVLDLVLPDISGERVLLTLREEQLTPAVVVFTGFDPDEGTLHGLGARWVVRKPDLDALGQALRLAAAGEHGAPDDRAQPGVGPGGEDRRRPRRPVPLDEPLWRSPSGIEPAASIDSALSSCAAGDTLVAVTAGGLAGVEQRFGRLLADDCLLEVGRAFGAAVRAQDSVLVEPECNGFLVVLRGGDDRAGTAAWNRARVVLDDREGMTGITPRATWTIVGQRPDEARYRVVGAVHASPPAALTPA